MGDPWVIAQSVIDMSAQKNVTEGNTEWQPLRSGEYDSVKNVRRVLIMSMLFGLEAGGRNCF
ncbi:MAG: hypothetical protein V8S01_12155 [Dorea sp.]